jgi:hypothetical protein
VRVLPHADLSRYSRLLPHSFTWWSQSEEGLGLVAGEVPRGGGPALRDHAHPVLEHLRQMSTEEIMRWVEIRDVDESNK